MNAVELTSAKRRLDSLEQTKARLAGRMETIRADLSEIGLREDELDSEIKKVTEKITAKQAQLDKLSAQIREIVNNA